ncbi:MAG: cytochrome C [Anaerolineae bacterium]|nr:cytochrome C [Anaerolineae bacterium]
MASQTMSQTKPLSELEHTEKTPSRLLKWSPTALLLIAAVLVAASIALPYWGLVLEAPQYPGGLQMRVFVNYMTGDEDPSLDEVREIDGLNHYIGMKSLYEAAAFERSIAIPGVIIMIVALGIVAVLRRRWVWALALPAIAFPFIFLGDLAYWMNNYGQNLDPYAPLSSAIQPFTPPIIGEGVIGQFKTVAYVDTGWYLAVAAAVLVVAALLIRLGSRRIAVARK